MYSYNLYFVSCLCLSYSLCVVCSDFDGDLTRRHYMYPDGKTGTLTMNGGAQDLFRQQPGLLASMLNSMEEEVVNHAHARRNNHSPENSARSSERNQTRDQATNVYTNYAPDYRYTGVGRTESVWMQPPLATQSITQRCANAPEQNKQITNSVPSGTYDRSPDNPAPQKSIKRRKTTRPFVPGESSDSDDECSDNAGQEDTDPLPYKTKDLSKATCWRCCTHLVRSWMCKKKAD